MKTVTLHRYLIYGTSRHAIGLMYRGEYIAHLGDDYPAAMRSAFNRGFTHYRNHQVSGRPHALRNIYAAPMSHFVVHDTDKWGERMLTLCYQREGSAEWFGHHVCMLPRGGTA